VPSFTPTLVPSNTPTGVPGLVFSPKVTPPVYPYLRNCNPGLKLDFSLMLSGPFKVHGVVLFLRLKNQSTGAETPWNDGMSMDMQGNGMYHTMIGLLQIPSLADLSRSEAKAWLEYQFVATDSQGNPLGRSPVFSDVMLIPCK
jgi:hypothetical protein